jgi:hypothetical protein
MYKRCEYCITLVEHVALTWCRRWWFGVINLHWLCMEFKICDIFGAIWCDVRNCII